MAEDCPVISLIGGLLVYYRGSWGDCGKSFADAHVSQRRSKRHLIILMLRMRSKDLQELMPAAVSNLQPKINMDKCCSSGFEPLGVYSPLYHSKPLGIGLANHALGHFCRPHVEWPWQPLYS